MWLVAVPTLETPETTGAKRDTDHGSLEKKERLGLHGADDCRKASCKFSIQGNEACAVRRGLL